MRVDDQNIQTAQLSRNPASALSHQRSATLQLAIRATPVSASFAGSPSMSPSLFEESRPQLFDNEATPEIPASIIPSWAGEFAAEVALSSQTPPAMAVMLTLAVLGTCAAKRYDVRVHDGFTEPLNLWTAAVIPPAGGKSHALSAITNPLAEWEQQQEHLMSTDIRRTQHRALITTKRIQHLQSQAAKCDDTSLVNHFLDEIQNLEIDIQNRPTLPKLWTADVTPARLQMLLAENGERMAVISDEGGIFEVLAGYGGGGSSNTDVFLKSHAGGSVRVDRMGREVSLHAPALSFGLAIQPDILRRMGGKSRQHFRGDGTLARFLYVVPVSSVGSRDVRAYRTISQSALARYKEGLLSLLSVAPQMVNGREIPRHLSLSPQAHETWNNFAQDIERRMGDGGDLDHLQDWAGKLPGAVLRIAGIFHLVERGIASDMTIQEATVERATQLGTLIIPHAHTAFSTMGSNQADTDAKAIYEWILRDRLRQFKTGDLWGRFKGRFTGKSNRLAEALEDLVARKIVVSTSEKTLGRPATLFYVNSHIWRTFDCH